MGRFFVVDRFHPADVEWVCKQLKYEQGGFGLTEYAASQTVYRHRQVILGQLGYEAFSVAHRQTLQAEARRLTHLQTKPARMLDALVSYLMEHRVEVPTYNTLRDILTEALEALDAHLQVLIEQHLMPTDRAMLDALLDNSTLQDDSPGARFPLTRLKHISQSMQPKQIAERVALFRQLKNLFDPLAPLILRLDLAEETIRYYAQYVLDNRSVHLAERVHERYLRLIAFVAHQYISMGDALILTLFKAIASSLGACEQELKEEHYQSRYTTAGLVGQMGRRSDIHIDALAEIERTVELADWSSDQKIDYIRGLLATKRLSAEQLLTDKQRLTDLKTINQPLAERADFYLALERASLRLQARVSAIVQALVFDDQTGSPHLLTALHYFQERKGELIPSPAVPLDFLDLADRQHVFTAGGKLRISLYKVLLFRAVRDALRDGSLTVLSSYDYRSVDEYQIPRAQWRTHRDEYLYKANLLEQSKSARMLTGLNQRLNTQFQHTNEGLSTNPQVYFDTHGGWHLHRYRAEEDVDDGAVRLLYPTARVIALRDVLMQTVGRCRGCTDRFSGQVPSQKLCPEAHSARSPFAFSGYYWLRTVGRCRRISASVRWL